MKLTRRHILITIAILLILFAINSLQNGSQKMPELSFTDIDNQQHSLSEYQGKPILVTFWATDCPGCIAEIPELIKLHNDFSSQGLAMFAMAMPHDSLEHINTMRTNKQLPYTIVWDKNAIISRAFDNVRVTPTHFLINPDGEIVMRKIGSLNMDYIHAKLRDMGVSKTNS